MRRRARIDNNQEAIANTLERFGCQVERKLARLGDGIPDLLVVYLGKIYLLEVKMPREQLTEKEKAWQSKFDCVHTVHSEMEALSAIEASEVKQ
jgi:hypothetical protein